MSFSPNLFLSHMKAMGGPAKTSRFDVLLPIPTYVGSFIGNTTLNSLLNFPNTFGDLITDVLSGTNKSSAYSNPTISRYLSLQCETAELPGRTLQTSERKIYGPSIKIPYQTQFQDITLTFLSTNDFYERKLFEKWIESIMPLDTNNLRYPDDKDSRYLTKITIMQYDEFVKQVYAVNLIDAFPIGISSQQLSWSDDNVHRLSVQFAYTKYQPVYDGAYDAGKVFEALVGSIGARVQSSAGNAVSNVLGGITSKIPGLGG